MVNLARPKVYKGWSIVKNSLRKEIVKKREELDKIIAETIEAHANTVDSTIEKLNLEEI